MELGKIRGNLLWLLNGLKNNIMTCFQYTHTKKKKQTKTKNRKNNAVGLSKSYLSTVYRLVYICIWHNAYLDNKFTTVQCSQLIYKFMFVFIFPKVICYVEIIFNLQLIPQANKIRLSNLLNIHEYKNIH